MAEDLIHARSGITLSATTARRRLLRNQGNTVYDLYLVHYAWISTSVLVDNEVAAMVLSTRPDDQRNDAGAVGFDDMVIDEGLFGVGSLLADLNTNGGSAMIANHTIPFSKPYTVPWLAVAFNAAVATAINFGVDIWFVRREESAMNKASLVARLGGGRARTE